MASISASVELYDRMSAPLMSIMNAMNMTISSMRDMQTTMGTDMNTSSLDAVTEAANQAQAAIEAFNQTMQNGSGDHGTSKNKPTPQAEPVQVPIEWVTNDLDVFSNSGIDRFQQEVDSTNQMLNVLYDKQNRIAQNASSTDIFSDTAINDINSLGNRIKVVQQRIQQIEDNPVNLGTDIANAELEQLRSQLNQAIQAQENLNRAVENMDVSGANEAYNQLSRTVANTERYIRDNADEQGNMNRQIQNGVTSSNNLLNSVKRIAIAYLSISSLNKILDISDELTNTTARIDMMNQAFNEVNGSAIKTDTIIKQIYASAQNARGSFGDMAAIVAKFGNNARNAFANQNEVIAFANLIQKQMTIAGASTQEASNAMLQLSQALGSGVLRGDELNSIFEQAPNLIQSIADYLNVPIGKIREMAKEGELSADIVKAAVFSSADEINAKFEKMPMTWNQVWTMFQNSALMAFQPVLNKVNELANNQQFQEFANNAINALAQVAIYALNFMNAMAGIAGFISENWSIIAPIVYAVIGALIAYAAIAGIVAAANGIMALSASIKAAADMMQAGATFTATAAQYGLNAALMACPLTWIILLVIALIAVIFAVANAIAKMTGIANTGFGVITGGINVVIAFFKNLGLSVANIALGIGNAIGALASNMMAAFSNAISNIQSWFYNLMSTALSVIDSICAALNKLPFVKFDYSGITNAASSYASKAAQAAGNKKEYQSVSAAFSKGFNTFDTFQSGWASDAFKSGASWGDGVADKLSGMLGGFNKVDLTGGVDTSMLSNDFANGVANGLGDIPGNIGDIAGNTSKVADSVDISNENLKYLRDIAETEAINRFTTAEITVTMNNNNTLTSDMDIDGVVDTLSSGVLEAMEQAAEGVH